MHSGVKFTINGDKRVYHAQITYVRDQKFYIIAWIENGEPLATGYSVNTVNDNFDKGAWIIVD